MVLDCTSLCLLAIAVGLKASVDTEKCAYCLDVRALTAECDEEPLRCAYGVNTDPNALAFCLTTVETTRAPITTRRVVRCISHTAYNLTLNEFRQAAKLRECHLDALRDCDCPNCRYSDNKRDYGGLEIEEVQHSKDSKSKENMLFLKSLKIEQIVESTPNINSSMKPKLKDSFQTNSTHYLHKHLLLAHSLPGCSAKFKIASLGFLITLLIMWIDLIN